MTEDKQLSKVERENYLIKLQKEFAFTGVTIPDRISVDGREIRLKDYVFEIFKKKGHLSPEEQLEVDQTAALLQKKRREITKRIASTELTTREADELFKTAAGIDRAVDTLYRAHEPRSSAQEEARKAKVQDGRRWLNLVRKVYSRGEDKTPRERS